MNMTDKEKAKKLDELKWLRIAAQASYISFRDSLPVKYHPEFQQVVQTYLREIELVTEMEKAGIDTMVAPVGFEPTSPGSEPGILPLDDRAT